MAKVLLVDTNFSSVPIYAELCRLGHEVHVVGGNPADSLAKSADTYWNVNYADTDALDNLINKVGFDYLVPGCTDRSYESCAIVNGGRFPGLDSPEVYHIINNKRSFRTCTKKLNLNSPQTQFYGDFEKLRWPLIVKPVDSFSGKGITVLHAPDQTKLSAAVQLAKDVSSSGNYLVEDYVAGPLYTHSAFLRNMKVWHDFIVQENCTTNAFVVDTSRVLSEPSGKMLATLRNSIERLAAELQITDGLIHTQFISNGDSVWLIEITRRCPGDLYSQLIELSTSFPYVSNYVRPFLDMDPLNSSGAPDYVPIMRHTITVPTAQSYGYVRYNIGLHVERWISLSLIGDQLKPSPLSRIGILFARAKSLDDLSEIYSMTIEKRLYEVMA